MKKKERQYPTDKAQPLHNSSPMLKCMHVDPVLEILIV